MSFNVDKCFGSVKVDLFNLIPNELVLQIYSYLSPPLLVRIRLVCKRWNALACDDTLWKESKRDVYEKAINNKKWAQWFGQKVVKGEDLQEEWDSLPWNIEWILKSRCPIFPKKRVVDTHILVRIPKTLNGQLNLKNLGELAKKCFFKTDNNTGYRFIWPPIMEQLGNNSIDKSHWVLMTKDVLPGSRNKNYSEQQKIVAELSKKIKVRYEVPDLLVSTVCIFSKYFDSGIYLFSDTPPTYIRCINKIQGLPIVAGAFNSEGLHVSLNSSYTNNIGIAALLVL